MALNAPEDPLMALVKIATDPDAFKARIEELQQATAALDARKIDIGIAEAKLREDEAGFARSQAGASANAVSLAAREGVVTAREKALAENEAAFGKRQAELEKNEAEVSRLRTEVERREVSAKDMTAFAEMAREENRVEKLRLRRIAEAMQAACVGILEE